jgi:hypothetical protein
MATDLDEIVEIEQEHDKRGEKGDVNFFRSQEAILTKLCADLNRDINLFDKAFKLCNEHHGKADLHIRIDLGMKTEKVTNEVVALLEGCNLRAKGYTQKYEFHMGALMSDNLSRFVMIRGVKKGKTFQVSPELRAFAENHAPKRSVCCNIL